jgi:acyl-coenzyme A synthetase/AMP-(fatty) acid ligase/rubrerythrin
MQCPKCHRPLDDETEGVYICCAGAGLRWRCTQCAKVSEGFAFPYGSCPHCGGTLEVQGGRGAEPAAALEGIRAAFEIELGGRAAAQCADAPLKQLFGRFALMEGEHIETLSRRYHLDVPVPSPGFRLEVAAIFADVPNRPLDPENLFHIAIGLENRAARFFAERAAQVGQGNSEGHLYGELAAEEREHAEVLGTELERWRAGKSGLFGSAPAGEGPSAAAAPLAGSSNAAAVILSGQAAQDLALVCGQAHMRYGELREAVARAAGYWRNLGVEPGDRIAVKLPDGIDWVTAFLGALWAGAVAVPVNPRVPAPEWHYILDEAGFKLILAEGDGDTPSPWLERTLLLSTFQRGCHDAAAVAAWPVHPQTPAFWCHSSGTSGKPKAVVHAHHFAQHIEEVSRDGVGITGADRLFASSKLFFSYPQTNSLWAGLKLGATVILDPHWPNAAGVAEVVAAQRPSVLMSVPSLYRNLLHEGLAPGIAQAGVRLCVSAGEALPASLRDEWRRLTGLSIVNGYGASETLVLVMLDRGDGRGFVPSPGIGVRPLNDVAPGMPTRLCIGASTLALGYLDRPQAQAESFRDGAFCAADLFVRDDNGGWRFAGREDSLVKIHGRWVNLVELEEQLSSRAPGLREGAAVLVPDEDGVDAVAFFFAASDTAAVSAALLERAASLPPHQRPRWWHAVDTLPRGPTGKLLRRKLQELHRSLD